METSSDAAGESVSQDLRSVSWPNPHSAVLAEARQIQHHVGVVDVRPCGDARQVHVFAQDQHIDRTYRWCQS